MDDVKNPCETEQKPVLSLLDLAKIALAKKILGKYDFKDFNSDLEKFIKTIFYCPNTENERSYLIIKNKLLIYFENFCKLKKFTKLIIRKLDRSNFLITDLEKNITLMLANQLLSDINGKQILEIIEKFIKETLMASYNYKFNERMVPLKQFKYLLKELFGKNFYLLNCIDENLCEKFTLSFKVNDDLISYEVYNSFLISCICDFKAAKSILEMIDDNFKLKMLKIRGCHNRTCLMYALNNFKNIKLVRLILDSADCKTRQELLNMKDDFGKNVLMLAAQSENGYELIQEILKSSDVDTKKKITRDKSNEGKVALDYFVDNISNQYFGDKILDFSKINQFFL